MASRESVDLFTPNGRRTFFRCGWFGDKWSRHYAKIDTFGHHICAVIGHSNKTYLWDDGQEQRLICLRCSGRIQSSEKEQSIKRLSKDKRSFSTDDISKLNPKLRKEVAEKLEQIIAEHLDEPESQTSAKGENR